MKKIVKLNSKTIKGLGLILAIINVLFAILWLFRVDLLLPALGEQLGSPVLAGVWLTLSVLAAIFSIPFLTGWRIKSKALRFLSAILAIVPAWIWTGIAVYTLGGVGEMLYVGPAVQFTVYAAFSANWAVLAADIIWLLFGIYVIKALGVEEIYPSLNRRKNKTGNNSAKNTVS